MMFVCLLTKLQASFSSFYMASNKHFFTSFEDHSDLQETLERAIKQASSRSSRIRSATAVAGQSEACFRNPPPRGRRSQQQLLPENN